MEDSDEELWASWLLLLLLLLLAVVDDELELDDEDAQSFVFVWLK